MIRTNGLIEVYSDMNTWIDFIISVDDKDFKKAKKISENAFNSYWNNEEAECMTLSEWIGIKLCDSGIKSEFYFKEQE